MFGTMSAWSLFSSVSPSVATLMSQNLKNCSGKFVSSASEKYQKKKDTKLDHQNTKHTYQGKNECCYNFTIKLLQKTQIFG